MPAVILRRSLRLGLARTIDFLLPPQCAGCRIPIAQDSALCAECWGGIDFIGPPYCVTCGYPFPHDAGDGAECGACIARTPAFDRARAAMAYGEVPRTLILGFKHGDRIEATALYARWLAHAGAAFRAEADIVTCVPLHRGRLFRRRYNQSALLANRLARDWARPAIPDLVLRVRATRSQGGLNAGERRRNVAAAFAINPRHAAQLAGRNVVLVDDVLTTGATVEAVARVLRRGGAGAVNVLTLARVVRDWRNPI
ncbi:DNA utilization protein GntX [Oceanibacterium hippocampi]|uniref:DNA utilization protein GntX n=2 Tax=Oceanibacterium hippocampi TaxID=745714 RepID=A0A1Y5RA83_9PROT|nr:DNA utilization protein GntX [Oceanibacterium hippocampi]